MTVACARPTETAVALDTSAAALQEQLRLRSLASGCTDPAPLVEQLGDRDLRPGAAEVSFSDAAVLVTQHAVLIGPWPFTDAAGCARCLAIRWQRLSDRYARDAVEIGSRLRVSRSWPAVTQWLADAVWAAYVRALRAAPTVQRRVTEISVDDLSTRTVALLPDPLCPACAPHGDEPTQLRLQSRRKPRTDVLRLAAPDDFVLDTEALVNPVCGVVGRSFTLGLTCATNAPVSGGIATRVQTDGLVGISWSGHTDRYSSSRQVALFEGLERYAGVHPRSRRGLVLDSFSNVRSHAVDPLDIGVYDDECYRVSERLTPYDPDRPMPWVPGWSLRDERTVLVPQRIVYFASGAAEHNFVYGSSNGCASGSCLEEAVLHGLLEVIERDAFLLGWYGGLPLPEYDLVSCANSRIRFLIDRADLAGYDVRAFDNRIDLTVPTVTALAIRRDAGLGSLVFAAAASLLVEDALHSALGELLSLLPGMATRVRNRRAELEAMAEDFDRVHVLVDHADLFGLPRMRQHAKAYLAPRSALERVPATDPRCGNDDLVDDVRAVAAQLIDAGCDVIVVDQTTPEQASAGLRSVSTVVPGMIPMDFGWGRQRVLRMPRTDVALAQARYRLGLAGDAPRHLVPHPFP